MSDSKSKQIEGSSVVTQGNSQIATNKQYDNKNFISIVQKWTILDKQLKIVNEKTKKMREMKAACSKQICDYIDSNNMKTTIDVNGGELKIYEKREYSPLSYNYIKECLQKIIKNPDHIDFIIQYLKDNREIKITRDVKTTYTDNV